MPLTLFINDRSLKLLSPPSTALILAKDRNLSHKQKNQVALSMVKM